MMKQIETVQNPENVIKEAAYLAWCAAGPPKGMGILQDNPNADKEDVWNNIKNEGDYPGGPFHSKGNNIFADYVFGRMLKLNLKWDEKYIYVPNEDPNIRYQGWCHKYETYESLIRSAEHKLT